MGQKKTMTRRRYHIQLWNRALTIIMLLVQFVVLIYAISSNSAQSITLQILLTLISLFTALHVMRQRNKGAYKITWIFVILLLPLFGGVLYWMFNAQIVRRGIQKRIDDVAEGSRDAYLLLGDVYEEACKEAPEHIAEIRYLQKFNRFPVYQHSRTEYYPDGELAFAAMVKELEKAEKYIFLEYFIIEEGYMWDSILQVLREKAAAGVDVRLIYDDLGCFLTLPKNYPEILRSYRISCHVFSPFRPLMTSLQNNRNHRKILSVDGKVAFTGGINLADEYINQRVRYGHWKDCAIKIDGYAAWSFTVMFLEMWSLLEKKSENYESYLPWQDEACWTASDGLVQPYSDSPVDQENVSEHVYMRIIEKAQDYLYITSPYLVIDDSMISALILAAKSGVDVRITTPHIPDKKMVQFVGRSYYRELIQGGIRIFEYTEGFVHSKTFVSDDRIATVGTVNMDFRSLYLHFECGVWLHESRAVEQVKKDFVETLDHCREVTEADTRSNALMRMIQDILRLFAPLI